MIPKTMITIEQSTKNTCLRTIEQNSNNARQGMVMPAGRSPTTTGRVSFLGFFFFFFHFGNGLKHKSMVTSQLGASGAFSATAQHSPQLLEKAAKTRSTLNL
jgi:hypothetical protein